MTWKLAGDIAKGTAREFNEDNILTLGAALAYYAMFSLGPMLAIAVALAGAAFGFDTVRDHIHKALEGMLGEGSAKTVDSMMAARTQATSALMKTIALASLLFGATGVFGQLQTSLNTIWGVKSKPGRGLWLFFRNRFLSFAMVLGVGFLLLVSLALSTALSAFSGILTQALPQMDWVAHTVDFGFSFAVITALFAMIFKFLPDVEIPWSKVWMGAAGTSLLFTLGKHLLGLYLGRESTASAYGAAGSVIVVLMWVYYASLILFLGAEFTQVYAHQTGVEVKPTQYAAPIEEAGAN
ncbi:MAG TPA: YihY/virulence factor BrkB family protein [Verrucomicrobiae bacterium]|nr:YihY/virulence factor BrkB family protein [Verrucomicrobiae bacterium]